MGYQEAMEAAGAKVIDMVGFNDYQGTWYALVEYKGERGWVTGYYGSCSGCDAFEGEFEWNASDGEDYQKRLADFGRGYLMHIMTNEEMLEEGKSYADDFWDTDAKEVVAYIEANCK